MKSFFLIFILLYMSLFPAASPISVVEIVEEELVAHQHEVIPVIVSIPAQSLFVGYPELNSMSPQSIPLPEHRPPEIIAS
jgi:hypothetical protein